MRPVVLYAGWTQRASVDPREPCAWVVIETWSVMHAFEWSQAAVEDELRHAVRVGARAVRIVASDESTVCVTHKLDRRRQRAA